MTKPAKDAITDPYPTSEAVLKIGKNEEETPF
jgi:hypothetical protein